MESGKVKWFDDNKGYGFIEQDVGDDLFVHYSDIEQEGYKTLREGQEVEFEIEETEKGLAAKQVKVLSGDNGEAEEDITASEPTETEFGENESEEEEVEEESFDEGMSFGT